MLFNSFAFICFLPVVLVTYYLLPHRAQNWFLLFASCFFYACWDWRFLAPLLLSTSIDYWCAARMEDQIFSFGLPLIVVQMIQYATKTLNFVKWSWFTPKVSALAYSILLYFVPFRGGRPESFIYFQFQP
jgi:hypothetical protein